MPFVRHFSGKQFLDTLTILDEHSDQPQIQGEVFIL